ncbi:hypothetical protein NDU88_005370 [Pleurodeles waltl]|uniref:Uncharacterized protein n=1 Tax=Pleurodeles waltl TaxID=8319 RepID=A0AAV7QEQ6_PLEWA|nr:hypothetical protein NDU88_005370 [Pleurodeles waltl]
MGWSGFLLEDLEPVGLATLLFADLKDMVEVMERTQGIVCDLTVPKLGREAQELLEVGITERNIAEPMAQLKNGKALGSNGFPPEFFKCV